MLAEAVTIAFVGGRRAMISGATGAIALVIAPVVAEYGMDYFIATVLLAGVLQIVLSLVGVAKLMRFLPRSVIRATLKAYLDSGAKLVFGESLVFPTRDLALIHTPWTMRMPDGSSPEAATAEVVRRQPDGSWKYVIDNPDGTALLRHE